MTILNKYVVMLVIILLFTGCQRIPVNQDNNEGTQESVSPTPVVNRDNNSSLQMENEIEEPDLTVMNTPSTTSNPEKQISVHEKEDMIFKCIQSTKSEIFELLGSDYETVYTGAEASYKGFYFKNYGITIVFDFEEEDSLVSWIDCDSDMGIFGIEEGMTFSEINNILGEAPIYETWYEIPEYLPYRMYYKMYYKINNCIVQFFSFNEDGSDFRLSVFRSLRRNVGKTLNNDTGDIEYYWHVDEVTEELTKISLHGETYEPVVVDKGFIEGRIISVSENLGNSQLAPCIIVAAEKDGVFTIYRSFHYEDFREYRRCDDQGVIIDSIKEVECRIENNGELSRYVIDITPIELDSPLIRLGLDSDSNDFWEIKN